MEEVVTWRRRSRGGGGGVEEEAWRRRPPVPLADATNAWHSLSPARKVLYDDKIHIRFDAVEPRRTLVGASRRERTLVRSSSRPWDPWRRVVTSIWLLAIMSARGRNHSVEGLLLLALEITGGTTGESLKAKARLYRPDRTLSYIRSLTPQRRGSV